MLKLKANPEHPTYKKLEWIIAFLESIKVEFEWIDKRLVIRDNQHAVFFDVVHNDSGDPITDLPPIFDYKLVRDKVPNKFCKCVHCDPSLRKNNEINIQ